MPPDPIWKSSFLFFSLLLLLPPPRPAIHVIPNETSHLLDPPSMCVPPCHSTKENLKNGHQSSPAPVVVAHQSLSARLAGIVRAKEGCILPLVCYAQLILTPRVNRKMVSVSARAPFTIVSAHSAPSVSSSPSVSTHPTNCTTTISRRPPVLTMTPARGRSQGRNLHLNLYADIRGSSPSGSRASSQRRPHSANSHTSAPASASVASTSGAAGTSAASGASAPERGNGKAQASAWLGTSGSDVYLEEEVPSPHPLPPPSASPHAHPHTPAVARARTRTPMAGDHTLLGGCLSAPMDGTVHWDSIHAPEHWGCHF
ncbi:hypothetical protein DFH09DRAFT_1090047 [Mycena vulgaris]|nr:hypothetical protein DFH09DRAFT_1090047 [Mycena vulgaris]